ncbi:acireductone synthase [Luteimonas pelagia]
MARRAILTDIEGTTGSISFVKDVLFPYARKALPGFVARHARERDVRRWLDAVAAELGGMCDDAMVVEVLQGWIDTDRKHTALKALQGMVWQDGYENADFAAHMYDDAATSLRAWHEAGIPVHVYSSGSVPAQKLFFGHSTAGDLRPVVSGWFDTEIGGKREVPSYQRIAEAVGLPAGDILFLSDVVEELDAAREGGMATTLVDRREDYPEPRTGTAANGHPRVTTFADIQIPA